MKLQRTVLAVVCLTGLLALANAGAEEPKYGAIEVTSDPSGARVYIEGFLAGESPVKVEEVVPGPYRVVVKKAGHADSVEDITVKAGEISKVGAKLSASAGGWHSPERAQDDWTPILDKDKDRYEHAKSKVPLRGYKVVEVANFLVKSDEEVPPDHLYALLRDLATQLEKKTNFPVFVTNYTHAPSSRWKDSWAGADEPTLILSGVLTRYQRGSRVKRYMAGFGAGKTRAYCVLRLVDKKTGEVVFERMENGSVSMGIFGGSSGGAMEELAGDIAKAIDNNW